MSLPPELIIRILSHLSDDFASLKDMSLVSKAWASWCQTHLFKSVNLEPWILRKWLKDVSLGVGGPALHTRTLTLREYVLESWINPTFHFPDFPLSTLASFTYFRSLTFSNWKPPLLNGPSPEPYFGRFGKSLCALTLQLCTLDPAIFSVYFPSYQKSKQTTFELV